ncbi:M48 family metallopeptidase [Thalassovita sp.]|jgi:putative metalloprotease|uniref:M48 family metallopeptidase n=1 Tax=Thalassovita sp. TaxID=1979401 RepID=UPI003B5970FD
MLKFTPLLLAILYAVAMYRVSAWRTKKELNDRSTQLMDPKLFPVLDRLAAALEVPQIKVYLYEVDPVNGLASPDGKVYLTRGFYRKFQNGEVTAEELASVIAHELGHVALGHTRRRMIDFSGQNALRAALAMFLSRFLPGVGVWIANTLTTLLAARMSRSDEYEADEYASALMVKAGFGTGPQKSLFAKLEELTGARAGAMPAWLISHPKTPQRIAAIEEHEAKWGLTE